MTIFKKAALGLTLAASTVAGVAPAQAQWRHDGYGYRHHDNDAGVAIGAGVLGLALGAAIASGSNHHDRYYDRGYYNRGYYDRGYYGRPYQPYYNDYRYAQPYAYRYRERCWVDRVYDEYRGGWVRIERCN